MNLIPAEYDAMLNRVIVKLDGEELYFDAKRLPFHLHNFEQGIGVLHEDVIANKERQLKKKFL